MLWVFRGFFRDAAFVNDPRSSPPGLLVCTMACAPSTEMDMKDKLIK